MSRRYCFTLNNYTEPEYAHVLDALRSNTKYWVVGKEVGESGTPHLQGFCIFDSVWTLARIKRVVSDRAHFEFARGTSKQASDYCKKDGSFEEGGTCPNSQGRRSDWDQYISDVKELGRIPTRRELCTRWPSLYARYPKACVEIASYSVDPPCLTAGEPRGGWQQECAGILRGDPDDRTINFVVDVVGGAGKSWFCKWVVTKYPDEVQVLRVGKRDDLAHAIDATRSIFLFDIPREQMTYLQYSVLEMLKDRMVFSPKYESSMKILSKTPHVFVFSNEDPDRDVLTADRYNFIELT